MCCGVRSDETKEQTRSSWFSIRLHLTPLLFFFLSPFLSLLSYSYYRPPRSRPLQPHEQSRLGVGFLSLVNGIQIEKVVKELQERLEKPSEEAKRKGEEREAEVERLKEVEKEREKQEKQEKNEEKGATAAATTTVAAAPASTSTLSPANSSTSSSSTSSSSSSSSTSPSSSSSSSTPVPTSTPAPSAPSSTSLPPLKEYPKPLTNIVFEFSPFQRHPRKRRVKDFKCNTIENDAEYKAFVALYQQGGMPAVIAAAAAAGQGATGTTAGGGVDGKDKEKENKEVKDAKDKPIPGTRNDIPIINYLVADLKQMKLARDNERKLMAANSSRSYANSTGPSSTAPNAGVGGARTIRYAPVSAHSSSSSSAYPSHYNNNAGGVFISRFRRNEIKSAQPTRGNQKTEREKEEEEVGGR